MKRTRKYVGLDVHQATTVTSVREASGRVIARHVLPTEASALVEYFAAMRGSVRVAFEEGTQAQWLHDLLVPVVDAVVVCDRRGEPHGGNKADRVDADKVSRLLLNGSLRPIYHGAAERVTLRELTRSYRNVVEDATRVMQRLKSLFRSRAIRVRGRRVYSPQHRLQWLKQLEDRGARSRAEALLMQLDVLRTLRPQAKAAMIAEARRDAAWNVLRSIPFLGPVRVALLLATLKTPWRFRTKRNLWGYAGLAVVTESSADHEWIRGRAVRRQRAPLTRGLNRNHNRIVKEVFKGAANAATGKAGALRDFYHAMIARGRRPEMARLTLARKLAALTLRLWKTGEPYDPAKLTVQSP